MILRLILQSETGKETNHLDFNLYDTPITHKVVELLNRTKSCPYSGIHHRIDTKYKKSEQTSLELATEMNDVIVQINNLGSSDIPDTCVLDLEIEPHLQTDKLNHLHLIFQQYSEEHGFGDPTQVLLERVNILVHMLESAPVEMDQVFIVAKQDFYRASIHQDMDLTITSEDYMSKFPWGAWGFLELDYNTVGKDLSACFGTNDVVLAKRPEELRQQEVFSPAFAVNFVEEPQNKNTELYDKQLQDKFYAWCEEHELPYDWKSPEYRLGRIRLGEVAKEWTMAEIQNFVVQYPDIIEIVAINDK